MPDNQTIVRNKRQQREVTRKSTLTPDKNRYKPHVGYLLLLFIIVFGVAISVQTTLGPNMLLDNSDDFYILANANIVARHGFSLDYLTPSPYSVSYLFEGIPAFFMAIFGGNLISESMLGIISLVGTTITVFLIGKNLKDEMAGLISALAFILIPIIAAEGATPGDGMPNAFFATLAVLLLLFGIKTKKGRYYIASGFVGFASIVFGSVETLMVFIFLVPAVLYLLLKDMGREQFRKTALFFAGIVLGICVVAVLSFILQSNPLIYFIHSFGLGSYLISKQPEIDVILPQLVPTNLTYLYDSVTFSKPTFNVIFSLMSVFYEGEIFGLWGYAMIISFFYLLAKKKTYSVIPFSWFIAVFLFLSFGKDDLSLVGYIAYNTKFLPILVPPIAVIIGLALSNFIETKVLQKNELATPKSLILWGIPVLFVVLISLIIVTNSFNLMGYLHMVNNINTYTTTQMANFLNSLPKSASVYIVSGLKNDNGSMISGGNAGGFDAANTIQVLNYLAWSSIESYGGFNLNLNYSVVFDNCKDLTGNYILSFGNITSDKKLDACSNLVNIFTPQFNTSLTAMAAASGLSLKSGMALYKKI